MVKNVRKAGLYLVLVLLVLMVLFVGGCGKKDESTDGKNGEKVARDTIKIAIPSEPSTMDVHYADDGNMRAVTENVIEGLLAMDGQTLETIPALAEEVEAVDDVTWNIKLREGVKYHNGNPFNADDVIFSIERQLSDELNSEIRGYFQSIDKVEKVSDHELNIITQGPDPSFPVRLTLLKMMDKETIESDPDQVNLELVGTGPYKFKEWKRGASIALESNSDYWGPKPAIKNVVYRFIGEDATRSSALKAGEVDLATNMLPEYVEDLPKVETIEGLEFSMVRLNAIKGIMKDKRMRQAACYAIDKEAIAESLYKGYASVAQGQVFKPNYFGFNPDLEAYPYDPEKAKQLMEEAGYNGEKIEFVSERGRWLKDGEQTEAIAQMLRDAGFNVEVKMLSFQQWLEVLFNRDKAPDMIFTFHSNDIFDADRTYSTFVLTSGSGSSYNDSLDEDVLKARKLMDLEEREKLYMEIGQTVYDDPGWIPIVNIKDIYGMQEYVNYQPREDMRLAVYDMSFK